jgi:phage terminase large subunit-like protein
MSAPTKELEKLAISKRLLHGGHPVLRWMADNVSVKRDPAGNLKPDKAKSTGRTDGVVATIMALRRYMAKPEEVVVRFGSSNRRKAGRLPGGAMYDPVSYHAGDVMTVPAGRDRAEPSEPI